MAVEYRSDGYHLTTEDGVTSMARCRLRQDGGGASASLKLEGMAQDSQVSANVVVVANTFHLFTKVWGRGWGNGLWQLWLKQTNTKVMNAGGQVSLVTTTLVGFCFSF